MHGNIERVQCFTGAADEWVFFFFLMNMWPRTLLQKKKIYQHIRQHHHGGKICTVYASQPKKFSFFK